MNIKKLIILICIIILSFIMTSCQTNEKDISPTTYDEVKSLDIMFEEKDNVSIIKKEMTLDTITKKYQGNIQAPTMMVYEKYFIRNDGEDTKINALRTSLKAEDIKQYGSRYSIKTNNVELTKKTKIMLTNGKNIHNNFVNISNEYIGGTSNYKDAYKIAFDNASYEYFNQMEIKDNDTYMNIDIYKYTIQIEKENITNDKIQLFINNNDCIIYSMYLNSIRIEDNNSVSFNIPLDYKLVFYTLKAPIDFSNKQFTSINEEEISYEQFVIEHIPSNYSSTNNLVYDIYANAIFRCIKNINNQESLQQGDYSYKYNKEYSLNGWIIASGFSEEAKDYGSSYYSYNEKKDDLCYLYGYESEISLLGNGQTTIVEVTYPIWANSYKKYIKETYDTNINSFDPNDYFIKNNTSNASFYEIVITGYNRKQKNKMEVEVHIVTEQKILYTSFTYHKYTIDNGLNKNNFFIVLDTKKYALEYNMEYDTKAEFKTIDNLE